MMLDLSASNYLIMACLVSAVLVSAAAWRLRWLTLPAALGGLITSVGSIVLGGVWWYLLGVVVFASGSVLGQIRHLSQRPSSHTSYTKHPRKLRQVAAYSIPSLSLLILSACNVLGPGQAFVAYIAVLATATSDNTATEIGKLSSRPPRLITNGRNVPVGTSGGVTSLGLVASAVGAIIIPLFLLLIPKEMIANVATVILCVAGLSLVGFCGSLFDSLLGATLQAKYRCTKCDAIIESPEHGSRCGGHGELISGIAIISNEMVNGLTASCAAIAALLIWR